MQPSQWPSANDMQTIFPKFHNQRSLSPPPNSKQNSPRIVVRMPRNIYHRDSEDNQSNNDKIDLRFNYTKYKPQKIKVNK